MSWEHLQQLFDIIMFPKSLIDEVQLFTLERGFHDIFISLQSFTDEPNMLDVTQKIQTLFKDDVFNLSPLYLTEPFYLCATVVQNKILLTKREIRAKYSFPKISLPLPAKFVGDILPHVLENIGGLVKIHDPYSPLYVPETVLERIEDVSKELKSLQNFVCFVSERVVEPQSQHHVNFFTHVLAVSGHASTLIWLYLPDFTPEQMNVMLSDFLRMRIKPIQPCVRKIYVDVIQSLKSTIQSGWYTNIQNEHAIDSEGSFLETILHNLVEVQAISNSSQRVALKDNLEMLQKMLCLLRSNIFRVPIKDLEFLLRDIEIAVIDVGLLVYSLYENEEENENMTLGEVHLAQVLDFSGNIQRLSIAIYVTIRTAFQSNLPRIHGLGYVDCLLNNLKEFQSRHSDSLASVVDELQLIQKEFESLQPFLEEVVKERHNDLDEIQHCVTQLIGKAHEIEYIVDACIDKEAPVWCLKQWILHIMEEITLIRAEVAAIREKKMDLDALNTVPAHTSNLARSPMMNEEIVGFEDVIEKLRDQLIKGTKGRDVISVVGMPGLGKTTLAYRLYYDSLVASHFDIRAQCCVSQLYSRKDLLMAILRDAINEDSSKYREKQADELADQLRRTLFSKRYLILVDDVWETSVWDDLIGCFQDVNNGSRIILTTRNHEVATYARLQSDPHPLRMFNNDESWELLRKKVFGEESCPPLLKNIGQQIAIKCGQLPLSVALVAGILVEMEKKVECWEQLANNLGPHIHEDSRPVIEQSYKILPYHLRSCFLYFGAFLEDNIIDVSKLTWLWISEGFIRSCEGKSLEDMAEGYLENLIGRNLVMGTKRSSRGKIKACRIHDLLHDFCKKQAKEELRLLWLKWDQNANPSSRLSGHMQLAHRMCIDGEGYPGNWSSCLSHVFSIILHNNRLSIVHDSHIFHNLKFLKVLDMESTRISFFSFNLVYLRYFAAETSHFSIITDCWKLETLKLKTLGETMSLPITLWEMDKLRHLHISNCSFTREFALDLIENSKKLHHLKTLSTPYFSSCQEAEFILEKTPNLRELRCKVEGVDNFQDYVLKFPARIETLKIHLSHTAYPALSEILKTHLSYTSTIPFHISAPNLKNLTLEDFYLHPERLSGIASLQNLQVLKLKGICFESCKWEVRDGEFPELRVLKLHAGQVHFEEWTVADDAFPNLERLVLSDCEFLMGIPSCFRDIPSLKSIEVRNCNEYVDKSARDIRETQVEYNQNSEFEVFIHQREQNSHSVDMYMN